MRDPALEQRAHAAAARAPGRTRPASTRRLGEQDTLTGGGAQRIAEKIRAFWRDAGFTTVVVEIIRSTTNETPLYYVRSNLIAGLPAAAPTKEAPNGRA